MSNLFCASKGRHAPDGVYGEAGPTSSHGEAAQYQGANVVAESYRSPRTACGPNSHAAFSQNTSVPAWHAQHMPASPVFYNASYDGTPQQPYRFDAYLSAAPYAPASMPRSQFWGTSDARHHAASYVPYDGHAMQQQHMAYMQQQGFAHASAIAAAQHAQRQISNVR